MAPLGGVWGNQWTVIEVAQCSHIVTQIAFHFIFEHLTLIISQPGHVEQDIEEIHLPRVQHHDIIVASDDLLVEVVFQLNSSATNVVWQASGQKSTPLTITLAYGFD
jgi:hypothetical protein